MGSFNFNLDSLNATINALSLKKVNVNLGIHQYIPTSEFEWPTPSFYFLIGTAWCQINSCISSKASGAQAFQLIVVVA